MIKPSDDDIIIHGDTDEIPQGDLINHIKHCVPKSLPITPQSMMFRFNFDWIHPDYSSLNLPEIFTKKQVRNGVVRNIPGSTTVSWSGTHLTDYGLPAPILAKLAGLAEGGQRNEVFPYLENPQLMMDRIQKGIRPCCLRSICKRYEDVAGLPPRVMPWVASANKLHFPELFPKEFPDFLDKRIVKIRNFK